MSALGPISAAKPDPFLSGTEVTWSADEPKEYHALGAGWTAQVRKHGSAGAGWQWIVDIERPKTNVSGTERTSGEAKTMARNTIARLLRAKPIIETLRALLVAVVSYRDEVVRHESISVDDVKLSVAIQQARDVIAKETP